MKKRRYSAGGGVPTTAGMYDTPPAQYPFPASSGGGSAGSTSNTTVNVNDQQVDTETATNPFGAPAEDVSAPEEVAMRRGGRVKTKRARGDGIAQRGKTKGRFV